MEIFQEKIDSTRLVTLPSTSLIIASRNRPKMLNEAVASILEGKSVPTELIIIDQSTVPNPVLANLTGERPCQIRYVWSNQVGLSRANNLGISLANYNILVFTHDDVAVSPTWFEELVQSLVVVGPRSVVTGQVRGLKEEGQPEGFQVALQEDENPATYKGRIRRDVLCPINMAFYRSAFSEIGGFDARLGPGTPFPAAEDCDLGFRLLEAGYQIVYTPQAVLYHREWRPKSAYLKLRWNYALGLTAFYLKHRSLHDPYMLGRWWSDFYRHVRRLPLRMLWKDGLGLRSDLIYALAMIYGGLRWLLTHPKLK